MYNNCKVLLGKYKQLKLSKINYLNVYKCCAIVYLNKS